MKLIDKSALVAEIERMQDAYIAKLESRGMEHEKAVMASISYVNGIKDAINTLEVKEVDLDFQTFAKEMDAIFALPSSETKNTEENPLNWEYAIAKHFFELGISVSDKAQKGE